MDFINKIMDPEQIKYIEKITRYKFDSETIRILTTDYGTLNSDDKKKCIEIKIKLEQVKYIEKNYEEIIFSKYRYAMDRHSKIYVNMK